MSEYAEARKCVERWTFINGNGFTNEDIKDIVGKALEIADRVSQTSVLSFAEIAEMYCDSGECYTLPECCSYIHKNEYCEKAVMFAKAYDQALIDIRGDNNG